jgi:hypothetical protein
MKYRLFFVLIFVFSCGMAVAETEQEQMDRMQRELNNRLFNIDKKSEQPATPPPAEEPAAPAPAVTAPAPAHEPQTASLPATTFTEYKLAGVSLGMEESPVLASLKNAGFTCNVGAAAVSAMAGHKICVYISTEEPRMIHLGMAGGRVKEIELQEVYNGGFPEKYFEQEKGKFLNQYGDAANCKQQRHGEICEVFGHGYRITLRSKQKSSKSTLVRRIAANH